MIVPSVFLLLNRSLAIHERGHRMNGASIQSSAIALQTGVKEYTAPCRPVTGIVHPEATPLHH
jgi:hypothetical protein